MSSDPTDMLIQEDIADCESRGVEYTGTNIGGGTGSDNPDTFIDIIILCFYIIVGGGVFTRVLQKKAQSFRFG